LDSRLDLGKDFEPGRAHRAPSFLQAEADFTPWITVPNESTHAMLRARALIGNAKSKAMPAAMVARRFTAPLCAQDFSEQALN